MMDQMLETIGAIMQNTSSSHQRGYAVLSMNFRGSTGYGRKHVKEANGQWGRKMQDDVTDSVLWAIEQGIADPDNICIYGASYGGYAVMAGITKTPDMYKCAVNYVGVTDMGLFSQKDQRFGRFGKNSKK